MAYRAEKPPACSGANDEMNALRSRMLALLVSACAPPILMATVAAAQPAAVTAEEAVLRKEPSGAEPGAPVGRLLKGSRIEVLTSRGAWREVAVDGWMWNASIADDDRDGYDGVVLHEGGENLREAPNGRIAARLLDGALLERLEEQGDWTNVRRIGWVWFQNISDPASAADAAARATSLAVGPDGAVLRASEGSHIATIAPGTEVEVLERDGTGRARIRVEGWVELDDAASPSDASEQSAPADSEGTIDASETTEAPQTDTRLPVATDIRVGDVRAAPGAFDGRTLQWEVEFVSLLHADAMRVDFTQGEPFILARSRDESQGFAYLAVPPDMVARAEEFMPLQNLRVTGRVRARQAPTVGNPILDVVEIEEIR